MVLGGSEWEICTMGNPVVARVPKGAILGSTLYINDLLIILSAMLLSMLKILLSTLSVIRHLICGNN